MCGRKKLVVDSGPPRGLLQVELCLRFFGPLGNDSGVGEQTGDLTGVRRQGAECARAAETLWSARQNASGDVNVTAAHATERLHSARSAIACCRSTFILASSCAGTSGGRSL